MTESKCDRHTYGGSRSIHSRRSTAGRIELPSLAYVKRDSRKIQTKIKYVMTKNLR